MKRNNPSRLCIVPFKFGGTVVNVLEAVLLMCPAIQEFITIINQMKAKADSISLSSIRANLIPADLFHFRAVFSLSLCSCYPSFPCQHIIKNTITAFVKERFFFTSNHTLCGDDNLIRGVRLTSTLIKATRVGVRQRFRAHKLCETAQLSCGGFAGALAKQQGCFEVSRR